MGVKKKHKNFKKWFQQRLKIVFTNKTKVGYVVCVNKLDGKGNMG